ncbi:MAG: hypothetical protein B7X93_07170 [Hydrogenophilales bacterium 17-61-9]|nr:MAG: hypothetical protein B7X93_07170 [Hydrogenophilales bacterium 17-61-9]
MKTRLTLKVLTASMLLASCAQTQNKPTTLNIQLHQEVRHSYEQAKAQYDLGRYYHGQLRYSQAIEAYRQALAMNPDMVDALNAMGVAYAESGDLALARQQFEAAQKLQPNSVNTNNNLGFVNYLAGAYQVAIEAFKQALRIDAGDKKARENLVLTYDKMGLGKQIARTKAPDQAVSAQHSMEKDMRSAWVEISPSIYAMHSPAVQETHSAETPLVREIDIAPVVRMATVEAVPVAVPRAATVSPAHAEQPSVAPLAEACLQVMNGNGVKGIARKVSRYLTALGYPSAGITNYPSFNEARTRIEYRSDYAEQARRLSTLLPGEAIVSEVGALDGLAKIKLVLGNDIRHEPLSWDFAGKRSQSIGAAEGGDSAAHTLPLEVANGNGVKGIARKVANYLSVIGYRTTSVYDLRPFNKAVTRIEYRKGYIAQAIKLGNALPGGVAYIESAGLRGEVRLVLGHDIKQNVAAWSPWLKDVKLAEAAAQFR